jgi:hypothetical protein
VRISKLNHKRVTIDRDEYEKQYHQTTRLAYQGRPAGSSGSRRVVVASGQQPASFINQASSHVAQLDVADELEKLAALHERGILTDAEFDAQKTKLLAS